MSDLELKRKESLTKAEVAKRLSAFAKALTGGGGAVALRKERAGLTPPAPGSDCECEFGEDRLEPAAGLDVVPEFVVAAA